MRVHLFRRALLVAVIGAALAPAAAEAAPRMWVGFQDDPSFRWTPDRSETLDFAAQANATVIRTTVYWYRVAQRRPRNAVDPFDPAYRFEDLDEMIRGAQQRGIEVLLTVWGTPRWAGPAQNRLPRSLADYTKFTRALASRYSGRFAGYPYVRFYSIWNEPNRGIFLSPQYDAKGRSVAATNYAKLVRAGYAGIKAANRKALVAIGETASNGRDRKVTRKGLQDTHSPGKLAELLGKIRPRLKFDAWAHHPYPTSPNLPPLQKVRWPNVTLSQMPKFETSLGAWFHRRNIPVWITEYGHETKPGEPHGVTNAKQAAYARQALTIARADKRVQMFVWFTIKDTPGNPWQSGLFSRTGSVKPAYASFSSLARLIDGDGTYTVRAGTRPTVKFYPSLLRFFSAPGETIGMTLRVLNNGRVVASPVQPTVPMGFDGSVTVRVPFSPAKGVTYTVTAEMNDPHGNHQTRSVAVIGS
jgi:cellulase (glycosyl hydrolase family 5)